MERERLFSRLTYEDRHDYDELGMIISNQMDVVFDGDGAVSAKKWDSLVRDIMRCHETKNYWRMQNMMEYVIFDMDWLDVPIQDYPVGNLAICHDPQKRLGRVTWSVVYVASEGSPPKPLGLFWDKDVAIEFATSFGE